MSIYRKTPRLFGVFVNYIYFCSVKVNEMEKKELRKIIRQRKAALSCEERKRLSHEVCRKVMETEVWQEARTIFLYMAMDDEVDTRELIADGMRKGKTVVLPTCVGNDLVLRVYEGEESMVSGAYGIMEPTGRVMEEKDYGEIDLAVVPGVAFDKDGGRMGRGRGFYDRTLRKMPRCYKMGVCWEVQMVEKVPMDEFDIKMNNVII